MSKTKRYTVKIDMNVWFDKNFTIEAETAEQAEAKAMAMVKSQYVAGHDITIDVPDGWTYGDQHFSTVYAEEEEAN